MTTRSKFIASVLVLAVFAAGGFLWFQNPWSNTAGAPKVLRMGSFSVAIDYAPYLVAKEKGWFEDALKDEGYQIRYTTFQTLPPINESFATDRLDVVFEAEVPAIIGRAAGVNIKIPALSCTINGNELLVKPDSPIKSVADLKGKKVAVLAGTGWHFALLKSLESTHLERSDVTVVDMTPPDAKAALETGAVDAWVVWPPWAEQAIVAGSARIVSGFAPIAQVVMVMRGGLLEENPEVADKVVEVMKHAKEWIKQNPVEARAIVSKVLDLPLKVVEMAWAKMNWDAELNSEVIDDIQTRADTLSAEGFIKQSLDVRSKLIRQPATIPFRTTQPQAKRKAG
jgi:sulfonate transport system substrate-binding protein